MTLRKKKLKFLTKLKQTTKYVEEFTIRYITI